MHMCIRAYAYAYMHMHMRICICVYAYAYAYMHMHMRICICMIIFFIKSWSTEAKDFNFVYLLSIALGGGSRLLDYFQA